MAIPKDLYALTACQILELLQNDSVTVEEYAESLLRRVKERDEIVDAWAYLGMLFLDDDKHHDYHTKGRSDPEFVLQQARALDQVPHDRRGPLHGIAVGIKDVMNTRGILSQQIARTRLIGIRYAHSIRFIHIRRTSFRL
jgi:Asp-tRNA(Asn)/Glu-tRNA(Gln) amidotransferase A subunit family amidase